MSEPTLFRNLTSNKTGFTVDNANGTATVLVPLDMAAADTVWLADAKKKIPQATRDAAWRIIALRQAAQAIADQIVRLTTTDDGFKAQQDRITALQEAVLDDQIP